MRFQFPSEKIYLAQSNIPKAGRGVFANKELAKGEIFEIAPVIELPSIDIPSIQKTLLRNYYFTWGKNRELLAIGLGYSSLYNHSYDKANATYVKNIPEKSIEYTALQTIHKDEEILVNYNFGNPEDKSPLLISDIPLP